MHFQKVLHAYDTKWLSFDVTRSMGELGTPLGKPTANFKQMDLLTAKEAAIVMLHSRMVLPKYGFRRMGVMHMGPNDGYAFADDHGGVQFNAKYFGPGQRNTLLNQLQTTHTKGVVLGGGEFGGAMVVYHEGQHTGAREAAFLHDKNEKGALAGLFKGLTRDPEIIGSLGSHAGRNYGERWAMGSTMVAFHGTQAPRVAQEIWAQGVAMNADNWGDIDRQAANLRRSLDTLYAHTDPATGLALKPEEAELRKTRIAASLGFGRPWTPGQPLPDLNPAVHGINARPQQERAHTAPVIFGRESTPGNGGF
ncbi:hypothetical protein ACIBSV_41180 [Embleya sp. NPDC050154]|uniref:hypothetical protein n=1 Tax=Embleya sp. NPDC050154 TaxID=3363988 RepID=UPI0037BCA248